ncbi:NAD-dependent epimerase/dehydratase family protein [soil metagenome]
MVRPFERAFVTGGSGFIGARLVRRLVAEDFDIVALARSEASAGKVTKLGAIPARGDLDDVDAMAAAAESCDVAFHLAAFVADWGSREDYQRGNVEGTKNALEACRRANVRRFVHCGTEAAVLAGQAFRNANESAPLRPDSPALYSATKAKAESLVREANGADMETVVVRPRFVWGAGDTTLLPEIAAAVENGKFAWVGGGLHRTSITHVDNVVEGLLLAAERGRGGEAYFVTDGEPVVFRDFISELLETQGVTPPERSVPSWLATALARGGELAWRVLPLGGSPPLTRFALWAASTECTLDDSKARSELGYKPAVTHEQGLAEIRQAS